MNPKLELILIEESYDTRNPNGDLEHIFNTLKHKIYLSRTTMETGGIILGEPTTLLIENHNLSSEISKPVFVISHNYKYGGISIYCPEDLDNERFIIRIKKGELDSLRLNYITEKQELNFSFRHDDEDLIKIKSIINQESIFQLSQINQDYKNEFLWNNIALQTGLSLEQLKNGNNGIIGDIYYTEINNIFIKMATKKRTGNSGVYYLLEIELQKEIQPYETLEGLDYKNIRIISTDKMTKNFQMASLNAYKVVEYINKLKNFK